MLDDPDEALRLGINAAIHASAFSWDNTAAATLGAYHHALTPDLAALLARPPKVGAYDSDTPGKSSPRPTFRRARARSGREPTRSGRGQGLGDVLQ